MTRDTSINLSGLVMPMFVFDSDGSLLPYFEACDSADVPTIFPPPNGEKVQYCMCPAATARLRKKLRHFWVVVSGEYENPHERALKRGWKPTRRAQSCSAMRCCYERAPRVTRMLNNDCQSYP